MESNRLLLDTLNRNTRLLLNCGNNVGQMKQAVDQLYLIYSQITGITIDQLNSDNDYMLPSGKAISTAAAAHCLLEMKRTALFLRGIDQAITLKLLEARTMPIRILYVGTGPYGTLMVPLLPLYRHVDLKVDMLDVNHKSLTALHKLTRALNLEDYINEVYCTDATTFTISNRYDIVICEAMLACLRSEPQVAIMQNLIPQLDDDCIFIPEEITIDACLVNPKREMDNLMYSGDEPPIVDRKPLGNVFTVSKRLQEDILYPKTLAIPHNTVDFPVLKLFTTVRVFGNEVLTGNDSSITLPKQCYDFREHPAHEVRFCYVQGEKPRIESCIVQHTFRSETVKDVCESN